MSTGFFIFLLFSHEFRLKASKNLLDGIVEVCSGLFEQADDVVVAEHGRNHNENRKYGGQEGTGNAGRERLYVRVSGLSKS